MLPGRLTHDPKAIGRLSHAVRTFTSETDWLTITSSNLDELIQRPLPSIDSQVENLCRWAMNQLGDDVLGQIDLPGLDNLAGMIGTLDGERVRRLLDYAVVEGLITLGANYHTLALTPKTWKHLCAVSKATVAPTMTIVTSEVALAHCNCCHGKRRAFVRATYTRSDGDGEVSWSDTYDVLECCGCGGLSVRRRHWFSEWDSVEGNPLTGQAEVVPGIQTTYWPPPTTRAKPVWMDELQDNMLRDTANEIYQSLNAGLVILANIGTRTLLDRAMFLRIGDPKGGFAGKISSMVEGGYVGKEEADTLIVMTDAGSAAAHGGYAPDLRALLTIVETVENFLHREFVLKVAASMVKAATPPRPAKAGEAKGA